MKVLNILGNILGILIAILLSLILFASLLTTPLVSTATSFLNSDTLYKVVKNIDFTLFFANTDNSQQNQLPAEILNELMKTEFAEDMITLYTDSLFNSLSENNTTVSVAAEDISTLANEHIDELLPILKTKIGVALPLSDSEIQQYAKQYIDELAPEIASMLPTLSDLNIDDTIVSVLHNLYTGKVMRSLLFMIGLLSFLILLCRFPRFKGFMWLGITYFCSASILFLFAFTVKSTGISLLTEFIPISSIIVTPFFSGITSGVFKGAGIIFALAICFIIIFILGRRLLPKAKTVQKTAA